MSRFICLDCGHIFEEPKHWVDEHGLDYPPYEEYDGCPSCGGAYTETYVCECCGQFIETYTYVEIGDEKYCENCFTIKNIDD